MDGKTTDYIKRIFEREDVKNWDGGTKWQSTTLMSMLENEKYKGDALLQKSYTVDFLTKKRTQNKGKIQMFYVEDDHDAIISKRIWECVQLEIKRRKKYLEEHGKNSYSHRPESNPFASKHWTTSRFLKMEHCWWSSWTERRLNVKMKRSKNRCRLGVAIHNRLFSCSFEDGKM